MDTTGLAMTVIAVAVCALLAPPSPCRRRATPPTATCRHCPNGQACPLARNHRRDTTMIEATLHTARQLQVLRDRAASIRRGDQVALLAPEGTDGQDIAGAVTALRARIDGTVALVVANRVHFVVNDA